MREAVVRMSVKILAVIYGVLLSLVIILAVPLSLLVWLVCVALNETARVARLVFYFPLELGELAVRQMLGRKLPQSANETRRKHELRQEKKTQR